MLKISISLSFCLGFANHVCQTNKLKTVHTLQSALYTLHYVPYRPEFSTLKTNKEKGHMGEMLLWLISILSLISTLDKLSSIYIRYQNFYHRLSLWLHLTARDFFTPNIFMILAHCNQNIWREKIMVIILWGCLPYWLSKFQRSWILAEE